MFNDSLSARSVFVGRAVLIMGGAIALTIALGAII